MAERLPGPDYNREKPKFSEILPGLVFLLVIGIIGLSVYTYFHNKSQHKNILKLTPSNIISYQTDYAKNAVDTKDYKGAVASYFSSSSTAFSEGDYDKSKALLEECIDKVPDSNVPYYIYNSLALTAGKLQNTKLEKSSLQTAIKKAQSDKTVTPETIAAMQKQLGSLN